MSSQLIAARRVLAIPARRRSTRLPDKMLLRDTGKTVLQHTYEAACKARAPEAVFIATDDEEIAAEARRFGADVMMTSPDCPSGADRIAEAVRELPRAGIIVNLQGDEPEADPTAIDRLFELLEREPWASVATAATPIREAEKLSDPACVKVVLDRRGRAMYFSRSLVPYPRDGSDALLGRRPAGIFPALGDVRLSTAIFVADEPMARRAA